MDLFNTQISSENIYKFSHKAMATFFELIIEHEDKVYAEQAAKAAFDEIDRLEHELSRFLPNSEISLINSLHAGDKFLMSEDTFECLIKANKIFELTNGAFDITVGQYKDKWNDGNINFSDLKDNSQSLTSQKFEIDETEFSITVLSKLLNIDLGGIGKGYALDKVCEQLLEWDIQNAFIHGGGSSVKSIGTLQNFNGWPITLSNPNNFNQTIANILIKDFSLSASGVKKGEHIFNSGEGKPIKNRKAAWAIANSAATSDALSTAFMVMDIDSIMEICSTNDDIKAMIIEEENSELKRNDLFISENFKIEKMLI